MEDMARLALVEQSIRDKDKFSKLLYELLRLINLILENPHDYELRTVKNELLNNYSANQAFSDYLHYIGFEIVNHELSYAKEETLSRLRMAQAGLERKIGICHGRAGLNQVSHKHNHGRVQIKRTVFTPENILTTKNPLLLKIESLLNNMVKYENEDLQQTARELIPLTSLQLAALDRVREQQRMIKTGETNAQDLPFDIALLMELLDWFKHKFFKWVDKPECGHCGGATMYVASKFKKTSTETCTVELYECTQCPNGRSEFPRYNDPRTLLTTRRGRCGEWANAFTLLCRALGYDTRYVYDTTDHVWCEVYDYDSKTWLHVDPCEAKLDTPLIYSEGWGKKLSYVFAVSRDDLQDVTWRYTSDHKQVLKRRNLCGELELIQGIITLRERRQRQVSEARRRYLARRTLQELVQLMVERTALDGEREERASGSAAWRRARGEAGARGPRHEFRFATPGAVTLHYCCATDEYCVTQPVREHAQDQTQTTLRSWGAGTYSAEGVFRKVETDWKKAYIARNERSAQGRVSWRVAAGEGLVFTAARVAAKAWTTGDGAVHWALRLDHAAPQPLHLGETAVQYEQRFKTLELEASLSGGHGAQGWQHAQLFRQDLSAREPALDLCLTLAREH